MKKFENITATTALSIIGYCLMIMLTSFEAANAQTCMKQSPAHTIALLELYSSEGCDSCPPADRFVSRFRNPTTALNGLTADQVVPVSFHVDYWDYLGWKDVYANGAFTDRQRRLSELASSRTIYTPEFFVAGKELRDWPNQLTATVKHINQLPAQADITISMGKFDNGALPVEVKAAAALEGKLYVLLYENGLVSNVMAGENRGSTLKHDYIVRDWVVGGLMADESGRKIEDKRHADLRHNFLVPSDRVSRNLGVAAFVQSDDGNVLQALSLPLCGF
jgi:hypothetical protein